VVGKDHKVKLTPITIGAEMPDLYVIQDGLKGDEQILLEGLRKVQNGDKINFDFEEPQKVLANLELPTE
jgi:membrane fusion protein (multidrug efflux system)